VVLKHSVPLAIIKGMKHIYSISIILIFVLLTISGCGGNKAVKGIADRELPHADLPNHYSVSAIAYNYFVNGTLFEMMGEIQMANRQYAEALKRIPDSREVRYAYASTFMQMRQYDQAIAEANKIKVKDKQTWTLLANSYRMLGMRDSSMASFENVLQLDPDNIQAYYRIASYYQQSGDIDSALWGFENIARISPTSAVYLQIANMQVQDNRFDDAIESYQESIKIDSSEENIRAFLGISALLESLGEYDKALKYLEQAEILAPQDLSIKERLLGFYQAENDRQNSILIAHKILAIAPNNTNVARRLAMIYFEADSLHQADSIFISLIDSGERNLVDYYYSGRIALYNEKYDRAKIDFTQLTIMADSVVDGWLSLGTVYRFQDSINLELATYESGLKHMKTPADSSRLLFSMGVTCERNNRFDQSVAYFEELLKLDPDNSQALNYLGYMLADKGMRLDYARELIEKALEIMPENGAYLDSYGWVLFKLGDLNEALEQLLLAYKYEKDDPVVMEHIGDVYAAMGDKVNASRYWNLALGLDPDNDTLKEKLDQ